MDLWLQITVAVALILIMLSMGLELGIDDFRRIWSIPRPALVGLASQLLLLPCLGFAFARFSGLPPELAVGVVIITACPGGAPSNIFTYIAGANVALSVTLTAVSSMITIVTIPLWVNLGLEIFLGEHEELHLPALQTSARLLVITIIPVTLGMAVRARFGERVEPWRPRIKRVMTVLFFLAATVIVGQQWDVLKRDFVVAAGSALSLVLIALAVAFVVTRLFRLDRRDAFTISVEVGLQNGALATLIVVNLLERGELLIFPGAYAVLAMLPVALWTLLYRARSTISSAGT